MKHLIIPDTQVRPGSNTDPLEWAAKYAVKHKPDVIVHMGDHWDMPSLCSYDVGKKSYEGRSYLEDIDAGNEAMGRFVDVIYAEQRRQRVNKHKIWTPRMVFLMGNHENRIAKAIESDRKLEGLMCYDQLHLDEWEIYDFLEVAVIDGIAYSHYFTSGVMGRPVSSARAMLTKKMMSTVMGHVQDRDIAYARRADGTSITGLFTGIFYVEDQDYLTPQTNQSWRGIWMLNEVNDGAFDEMPVSMNYLAEKYGG